MESGLKINGIYGQKPKNIDERKENTVRCEGRCPEEEYNRDVCKQTHEAGELDGAPRPGPVPVGP